MAKTILLTTEEYSKYGLKDKTVTQQAIRKAIAKNKLHLLPGVVSIKKAGKYHLLEVNS